MTKYCTLCWTGDNKVVPEDECTTTHRTIRKIRLIEIIEHEIQGLQHQLTHMSLDKTTYLYLCNEIDRLKEEWEKLR